MYCFWTSQCYFTKSYAFSFFSACDNPTFMRGKLTEVSRGQWHWGTVIVYETVLDFVLDLSSVSDFGVEKTEQDDWNWRYGELFMSFITYFQVLFRNISQTLANYVICHQIDALRFIMPLLLGVLSVLNVLTVVECIIAQRHTCIQTEWHDLGKLWEWHWIMGTE